MYLLAWTLIYIKALSDEWDEQEKMLIKMFLVYMFLRKYKQSLIS